MVLFRQQATFLFSCFEALRQSLQLFLQLSDLLFILGTLAFSSSSNLYKLSVKPFLHFSQQSIEIIIIVLQLPTLLLFLCQTCLHFIDNFQVLVDLFVAVVQTFLQLLHHFLLLALSECIFLFAAGQIVCLLLHVLHQFG